MFQMSPLNGDIDDTKRNTARMSFLISNISFTMFLEQIDMKECLTMDVFTA